MARFMVYRLSLWLSGVNFGLGVGLLFEGKYSGAAINMFIALITYGLYHIADEKVNGF